jgi:hypothetical protein
MVLDRVKKLENQDYSSQARARWYLKFIAQNTALVVMEGRAGY